MNNRISRAFAATPAAYLERCFAQRNPGPSQAGSCFSTAQDVESMLAVEWAPYEHPALMAGCSAYRAPIGGSVGLVQLSQLDPSTPVRLDDSKNTGKVCAVVGGVRSEEKDFTVLILGPHEGSEVVYTFHPGEPIAPSQVDAGGRHDTVVSAAEALKLGLEFAKVG